MLRETASKAILFSASARKSFSPVDTYDSNLASKYIGAYAREAVAKKLPKANKL